MELNCVDKQVHHDLSIFPHLPSHLGQATETSVMACQTWQRAMASSEVRRGSSGMDGPKSENFGPKDMESKGI